jgi:hypothetical protein
MAINWDADPVAACWVPLADCSEDMRMILENNPLRVLRHRLPKGSTQEPLAFIRESMATFKYLHLSVSENLDPTPPKLEILSVEDVRQSDDPRNAKFKAAILKWDAREKAENIAMFGFDPESAS